MNDIYKTINLTLNPLGLHDACFIYKLLNTEGWIKFIGNRNINNNADAIEYINRVLNNKSLKYWVVRTNIEETTIGIITLIKREYLNYHDIGFAFLPSHSGKVYAFEASSCVLIDLLNTTSYQTLLATTLQENTASIKLLKKLGFSYYETITNEGKQLLVYQIHKTNPK